MKTIRLFASIALFSLLATTAGADDTRLLRNPAISDTHVAFVYANDIWIAPVDGGNARRLTTFEGAETEPHFSPDGNYVAFSGQYDGNTDVYVVSIDGGEPRRLTWHPSADLVRGWSPDGSRIVFASARINVPVPVPRFFEVSLEGGMPQPLPIPRVFQGKYSPDGGQFAYQKIMPWESEFRNYRGGQNNPIRVIDLATLDVEKLPWDEAERPNDHTPVWVGDTIFFLSDRDYAMNVWAYDRSTGTLAQRTFFTEFDCKQLEAGGGKLIFENGGWLYTFDPEGGEPERLSITVLGDFPWARPHWVDVGESINNGTISPTGKRALFEARGDIFTVPAEKGEVRNLTSSPGAADRTPAWSPDGQSISWFSDQSGEYQLVIADQFGKNQRTIELENPTFYYTPKWSPNSKYLAFTDTDRVLRILEVETGEVRAVDSEGFATPGRIIAPVWSADSRWIAYTRRLTNQYSAVFLYDVESGGAPVQLTDGMANAMEPAWDKNGKYLYFMASTNYGMSVAWLDMSSYPYQSNYSLYLAVLQQDEPNPFAFESDDEEVEDESDEEASKEEDSDEAEDEDGEDEEAVEVNIDFDGIAQRIVAIDVPARPYSNLQAGSEGTLFYMESAENEPGGKLHRYSLEERESTQVMEGLIGYDVSYDGNKLLYATPGSGFGIVDAGGEPSPGDGALDVSGMRAKVDPALEWKQIFREAIRLQRDYFYVENVHGLDLDWAERTYGEWLSHVRHRSDLNYILDILGGETAIGHSFVFGGDEPDIETVPMGLLGADLESDAGRYRISKIFNGESWNPNLNAPLAGPGIEIAEGDYILAVNGRPLTTNTNPFSLFERTAGMQTTLLVNDSPSMEGAREVTVQPVANEQGLRMQSWMEDNRRRVDELSNGRLAYVWLPNTGFGGYNNFNRYLFAQQDKKGAVLDERYNGGGSIADYMVDLLSRQLFGYFNNPIGDRQPWMAPNAGIWGPKVMIVNDAAGSGGDMLPYMFREKGIGPLVGTRTWGGLVGIWDVPSFIDGGAMTAPRGGFFTLEGEWAVENEGVAPDYPVEQTPKAEAEGRDLQLEKAVDVALELLETGEVIHPSQPADPIRVRRPGGR